MGLCWRFCTNWGMGLDGRGISTLHRIIQQMDATSSLDTVHLLTAKLSALNCEVPFLSAISMQVATSKAAAQIIIPTGAQTHVPTSVAQTHVPKPPTPPPPLSLRYGRLQLQPKSSFPPARPQPRGSVSSCVAPSKAPPPTPTSPDAVHLKPTSKARPTSQPAVKDEDVVIIYA